MPDKITTVLIVDDNQVILDVTAASLETEGFAVITAPDGNQGLEKIRTERPDVVLLDLRLPDIDGFEVCKATRANTATARIPIIMMTGDRTIDIDQGFAVGADDCIIKPIDMKYLIGAIRKFAQRRPRVTVVDDDRHIGEMLSDVITKLSYDVDVLYDGTKLFELVEKNPPHLIFLDISLPVQPDGIELCRKLKQNPATKGIPVVMLTANEDADSVEKCFGYGAEDYIFKPFSVPDILLKIKKHIKPATN